MPCGWWAGVAGRGGVGRTLGSRLVDGERRAVARRDSQGPAQPRRDSPASSRARRFRRHCVPINRPVSVGSTCCTASGSVPVSRDDMGLGKTIQVLSLLLILKHESTVHRTAATPTRAPSLLAAPASLLANWAAEIERFAADAEIPHRPILSIQHGRSQGDDRGDARGG